MVISLIDGEAKPNEPYKGFVFRGLSSATFVSKETMIYVKMF